MSISLPILMLPIAAQRYSCHGCGNCCRDFTVQLREADLAKLRAQDWETKLAMPVTVEFRATTYLRQREDGACVFLMDDGLCRIHKEYGFAEKPIACQMFPFVLVPDDVRTHVGISFACQSVRENKGAELRTHIREVDRMSQSVPETRAATYSAMLADAMSAKEGELDALRMTLDRLLAREDWVMRDRFDGLAWIAANLGRAKLVEVRANRFRELVMVLASAVPAELEHLPLEAALTKQMRLLRQAVYARLEDVQVNKAKAKGRWRTVLALGQCHRSRAICSKAAILRRFQRFPPSRKVQIAKRSTRCSRATPARPCWEIAHGARVTTDGRRCADCRQWCSTSLAPRGSPARSPPSAATRRPPSTMCATRSAASIATLAARRGLVRSASGCASSSSGSTTDYAASRAKASNQAHLFKPIYSSASIQAHLIKRAQAA